MTCPMAYGIQAYPGPTPFGYPAPGLPSIDVFRCSSLGMLQSLLLSEQIEMIDCAQGLHGTCFATASFPAPDVGTEDAPAVP